MGIEAIVGLVAGIVTLATYVVKLITDIRASGKDAKLTDTERLLEVSKMAVAAAEELGAAQSWSGQMKKDHAVRMIKTGFPQLNEDDIRNAMNAAVNLIGVGLSGKK